MRTQPRPQTPKRLQSNHPLLWTDRCSDTLKWRCGPVAATSCWVQVGYCRSGEGMRIQRRTLLAAGVTGMAWTATRAVAAVSNTETRFVFHVSSGAGRHLNFLVNQTFAPIYPKLAKRGVAVMIVTAAAIRF